MSEALDAHLLSHLVQQGGAHRRLRPFIAYGARELQVEEAGKVRRLLNFASNDYLALADPSARHQDPSRLIGAGVQHGEWLNAANDCSESRAANDRPESRAANFRSQPSSRLMGGNHVEVMQLEAEMAETWGFESALFYPTGYMANMGVLSCCPQAEDLVLMDRLCHASLIDGIRLSSARFKRYRHLDMEHLEKELRARAERLKQLEGPSSDQFQDGSPKPQTWVVTESLFSMDGDLVPVKELLELKDKYGFILMVDEAHGMGVYHEQGLGWFAENGALSAVDVLSFNLSKSFGMQGGVVMGSTTLTRYLVARSRTQIYTTATPLSHLELLPQRRHLLVNGQEQRDHLRALVQRLLELLKAKGMGSLLCSAQTGEGSASALSHGDFSPIVPLHFSEDETALRCSEFLWGKGFCCPAILPPTVPVGESRLRLSLNAALSLEDIEALVEVLELFVLQKL